jgi:hypothetical protein
MEQMVLYKGFRVCAYEDWSGLWLAEAKKPLGTEAKKAASIEADTDAEYIAPNSRSRRRVHKTDDR